MREAAKNGLSPLTAFRQHIRQMSPLIIPIAVPGVLVLFIVNMLAAGPFGELCQRIAERDGRQPELRETGLEGGSNYFEIEQQWKLWRRDYRRFGDDRLNVIGDRAFKRAVLAGVLNLTCVFALIYALAV